MQLNANFFQRDSSIGAAGTPLYDNLLSGGEAWFTLNYTLPTFDAGVRFDAFLHSNLHNPQKPFSEQGLGFFYMRKQVKELTITAGYFYDIIGSGIIYRSYEERGLGIDYATAGIRLQYDLAANWKVKGFVGRQKNLFKLYNPIIKGASIDGYVKVNDKINFAPGTGILNRTMDPSSMNFVISNIKSYPDSSQFQPMYNVYAGTVYNTLNVGNVSWYVEAAGKTKEASYDFDGNFVNKSGSVLYSSLTYSVKGFGVTLQGKRTENFDLRTSPNERLLQGTLNFLPSLTRQNTFRLPARYAAATQTLGEIGGQADVFFTPKQGYTVTLNYSNIKRLSGEQLYQEVCGEFEVTALKKFHYALGGQTVFYNMAVYRVKAEAPDVKTITPFIEATYKINRKHSVRTELQYMMTEQDYGSWAFALVEYSVAPHLSFAVSDMYNVKPNPEITTDKKHYYNVFGAYTRGANRFSASYVKQVEGITCTGGVCRYEPAFSGLKLGITSTF